ncbi:MAG TPA: CotH kinase family protein [Flavobacteriales bacterium]|nr:CotH kinase family protein [Flavobacteriales bacterium]
MKPVFSKNDQVNTDLLESGKYNSAQTVFLTDNNNYRVVSNQDAQKSPISRKQNLTISDLRAGLRNRLMYISTSPIWKSPAGDFQKAVTVRIEKKKNHGAYYRTYFNSEMVFHLPVVSLVVNEADFFDESSGINVQGLRAAYMPLRTRWWDQHGNYQNKGKNFAVNCFFEYFSQKGNLLYSSFADIRIHGNATRAFPQKSYRLEAKGKKNKKFFQYDFFSSHVPNKNLVLRQGGNDWGRTLFADAVMQELVSALDVEAQAYAPVVLYLNGEYWGIYSLRQKFDEDFVAGKYKCKKKNITFIENDELKNGSMDEFAAFKALVDGTLYETNYKNISEKIDLLNFMHYIFSEVYFANTDWPHNNCKYYKCENGKWRWGVYDLDYGYGYTGNPQAYETDLFATLYKSPVYTAKLFRLLMTFPEFRKAFKLESERIIQHELNEAGQFQRINAFARRIEPEINNHIRRWRKPRSLEQWRNYVQEMKIFVTNREAVFMSQLKKYCK